METCGFHFFLLELDSEKTHGMITVEREMGTSYLIFSQKERLYLIIQHAADLKIANLVRSAFPSTYTQTEAAPYLPLPPPHH